VNPSAVILLVLGILWLVSAIPWPQSQVPGWAGNVVAFLFCVVLALHVYHAVGL
jgi:hypothetical protein